ncbi:VOC family protein [Primorskyibacter sp. S187A]|uniref:VOC family protein n=1 Tax=Primorskyibacter sp. S187A TaxID=3415130 RepID=UPI003C7E2B39
MRLTQLTPFILCADLDRAIGFYEGILGFTLGFRQDNYAFLRRDQAALRLIMVDDDTDLTAPDRENSIYIDVEDLDAVFAEMKPRLDKLKSDRVRAPFNQAYGQREFHIYDEDCTLVFFGEAIT